jgi:HemY protein
MIKVFLIFIFLSLTGFITIWLKQDPGNIDIEWQGWIIETSVPIIIVLIGLLLLLIILSYLIIKKITSIPKTIKKNYKNNKNDKANSAL